MPFDVMPQGPCPVERRQLELTLDILRRAQHRIANPSNWISDVHRARFRNGRILVCAREAITEAGVNGEHWAALAAAYRAMAMEVPETIRQMGLRDTPQQLIERANDMEGGHARVMGMFCRAIARLELALA